MITKHPWFGPKRIGWGWRPVSWEGWLATWLCAAIAVAAGVIFGNTPMTIYVCIAAVVALLIVCLLTGTGPG
ncbi:MAG TPA: hypothetical protein VHU23_19245 [Rhizomicrobium sp.]|jgi:hypothetical protein|nr:hypothetical protein [Rhizomicrobium sp.]